jgi:quercetin dioxygenase-like cupin family protein
MLPSIALKGAAAIFATAAATAMVATAATASPGHGVTFTTLSGLPQTFADPDQIISEQIKVGTKDATTVRIQSAVWEADSDSGWHHHPGVIMGIVTSGSITVWSPTCGTRTYGPGLPLGAVFLEGGNELMKATSAAGAAEYVVHIFPVGAVPRGEDDVPSCDSATTFRVPK